MAFGLAINTSAGMKDITGIRSAQLLFSFTTTAKKGSKTISIFDPGKGFIYSRRTDGGNEVSLDFRFDNSTKVFYWDHPNDNADSIPRLYQFYRTN